MEKDYKAIIAEGAKLLDTTDDVPDHWRTLIDPETFSIASGVSCALGQIYNLWVLAPEEIRTHNAFLVSTGLRKEDYAHERAALDDAWRNYLTAEMVAA